MTAADKVFEMFDDISNKASRSPREFSVRLAEDCFFSAIASLVKQNDGSDSFRDSVAARLINKDRVGLENLINQVSVSDAEVDDICRAYDYFDKKCTLSGFTANVPEFYKKILYCRNTSTISTYDLGALLSLRKIYEENIITDRIFKGVNSLTIEDHMFPYQDVKDLDLKIIGHCKDRYSAKKSPVVYCLSKDNFVYRLQLISSSTVLSTSLINSIAQKINKIRVSGRVRLHKQPGRNTIVGTITEGATVDILD